MLITRLLISLIALIGVSIPPSTGQFALQAAQVSKASHPGERIPAEAFARLPFIEHASISPNGEFLAGLMAHKGEQMMVVVAVDPAMRKGVVRLAIPNNSELESISWANDRYVLANLTAQLGIDEYKFYVARMVAIDRLSGKAVPILPDLKGQNTANVIWIPPNGRDEILVAGQASIYGNVAGFWPSVYRVNLKSGRGRLVQLGREGVWDWGADHNGTIRIGFGFDDFKGTGNLLYRRFDGRNLNTVERAARVDFERLKVPLRFLPDSDMALALDENADGQTIVVERDMLTQTNVGTRYEYEGFDVLGAVLSRDRSRIMGLRTNDSKNPMRWLDDKLKLAQTTLDQATPNSRAEIVSFSRDRTRMLALFKTPDSPGLMYFYDSRKGTLNRLAALNRAMDNRRLAKAKYIDYDARDGLEIQAVLTLPKDREPKNLPLIVMPHGGPWAHDTLRYDYWSQFLADRGYAVIQPNFRGSTGYGNAFQRKGNGELGFAMQDDLTDGLNHLVREGIADPKRVCIVGGSYGGYAAMWGIVRDPEQYRCAISIAGVAKLREQVNDFGGRTSKRIWRRMTPDFDAVSPVNFVDKIQAPLLLIHGRKDVTVEHEQSEIMDRAMRKAKKKVDFVSLKNADHYFTREPDRLELLQSIERFLAEHNPAD